MFEKKLITIILSVILCFSVLTGCNTGKNKENTASQNEKELSEVILSVEDESITAKEFRYYVYMAAVETAYSIDSNSVNNLLSFDWKQKDADGKPLSDVIIQKALDSALNDSLLIAKAKKNGFEISNEELKNNNQAIDNAIAQNGEESFLLSANSIGITDVDSYKNLANRMMMLENSEKEITDNIQKYIDEDVELSKWKSDEKVTAQHVLISNESDKFSDPEATANEVLAKAKAGENFATLIEEYNEDPGATEAGYTFGRGEMVKEFEEASYSLECGEISDVVKTEYGYHIIRRVAGLAELQNYWMSNAEYNLNEKILAKVSVEDIMATAANAQKKMQQMNQSQQDTK